MKINLTVGRAGCNPYVVKGDIELTDVDLLRLGMMLATIQSTGKLPPREAAAYAQTLTQALGPMLKNLPQENS